MNPFAFPSMAAFVIALLLGIFVYTKNPYNQVNRIFMLLSSLSAYLSFTEFMMRMAHDLDTAILWQKIGGVWPLLISVLFHFVMVVTGNEKILRRFYVLGAVYIPSALFVAINIFDDSQSRIPVEQYWGWSSGVPGRGIMIWSFIMLLVTVLIMIRHFLAAPGGRVKKQAFFMLMSFALPVATAYATNIMNIYGVKLPEMFTVSYITGSAFIAYAIWQYELFIISPKTTAESIVRTITDGMIMVLPDGNITSVNGAFINMTGFSEEELIGRRAENLFFKERGNPDVYRMFLKELKEKRELNDYEGSLVTKKGVTIPVSISVSKVLSRGRVQGFIVLARDITERVKNRKELLVAKEKAESANRTKSLFLANMSHEIRTPMNSIIGFTNILREKEEDDEKIEMLDIISRAGQNLLNLINDILDFSKIEAGKMELEKISFSLRDLLGNIFHMFRLKAAEKGVEMVLDIDKSLPDHIFGDEHRINQIMVNIMSNAVKFTREGSVKVSCSYEKGTASISVKDTGIGIPVVKRHQIFTAFRQGDVSTTREFGGTGLGLAITSKLVEKMGGSIDLYSEVDKGSDFVITLPLPEVKKPYLDDIEFIPENIPKHDGTIAIIENNENDLIIIDNLLEKNRYKSVVIENPEHVADDVCNAGADLVLLDIKMQGLNGFQINDLLKSDQRTAHIPVVVCSIIDGIEETVNYGVFDYIRKPLDETEFSRRIHTALVTNGDAKNVFVIDDDRDMLSIYKSLLHAHRYNVFLFDKAMSALDDIRKGIYPDLIILDLMMPEMDGFQFLGELRDKAGREDIPVVIVTAKDLESEDVKELEEKCLHVFNKTENMNRSLMEFLDNYFRVKSDNGTRMVENWIRSGDGDKVIEDLLAEGIKKLPHRLQELQRMMREKEVKALRKCAHDMKGFTGNYGMKEIFELFSEMDSVLQDDDPDMNRISDMVVEINELVDLIPGRYLHLRGKGLKAIVAEDNDMNQKLMAALLKREDVEFEIVSNGQELLDALKSGKSRFDIVFLDIQMPVMDGFETIRRIREDEELKDLYVVALTAYAVKGDAEKCLKAGCDDYLPKPVDKDLFRYKLERLKENKRLHGIIDGTAASDELDLDLLDDEGRMALSEYLSEMDSSMTVFIPEEIIRITDKYFGDLENGTFQKIKKEIKKAADEYNDERVNEIILQLKAAMDER